MDTHRPGEPKKRGSKESKRVTLGWRNRTDVVGGLELVGMRKGRIQTRGRIEELTGIGRHFGGDVETLYNRNLLESMGVTLVKTPNNRAYGA